MNTEQEEIIIEARDVYFSYEGEEPPSLNGVSLKIGRGKKVAFMGANGSGKSTFFLCCNGINRPDKGCILIDGKPIEYTKRGLTDVRRRVGIVFQDPDSQLFSASVYQEISFGPMNLGLPTEQVRGEIEQVMDYLEITPFRHRPTHALSGGQKKQVSIADVLVMHPDIIIMDEPVAALDTKHTKLLNEIVDKLADEGITILMATHNMDYALEWADEIVLMHEGRVLMQAEPVTVCGSREDLERTNQEEPVVLRLFRKLVEEGILPETLSPPKNMAKLEQYIVEGK